jgi:glycosyltransferase involved in cell wall biosynthesis
MKRLHVEENVRLVGFQNDVVSFLHALDAFVFATTSEGFGQVLVEAMAAGKAVVASKVPPLTEIADGQSALLVEPGKPAAFTAALSQLLGDPVGRQRMGRHGRERVQKYFTAERMAAETISLYEEACGQIAELRSLA